MAEPPSKKARIHFGSLEVQEKKKIEKNEADGESGGVGVSAAVLAGIQAGNINVDTGRCAIFWVFAAQIKFADPNLPKRLILFCFHSNFEGGKTRQEISRPKPTHFLMF